MTGTWRTRRLRTLPKYSDATTDYERYIAFPDGRTIITTKLNMVQRVWNYSWPVEHLQGIEEIKVMRNFKGLVGALLKDESGQDLIEYALVAGLIGLGAVTAMNGLSTAVSGAFSSVSSRLTSAV